MSCCHACLRRCLRTLNSSSSYNAATPLSLPGTSLRLGSGIHTSTRRQRDLAALSAELDDGSLPPLVPDESPSKVRRPPTWSETRGNARRVEMHDVMRGKNPKRLETKYLQTELKYLNDPLKLAEHVKHVLQNKDEEKADALVKLSSRSLTNTVSWNHLIDYQMKSGRIKIAFETYNDMKKRGQRPDNVTYTLLLRGLADYAHYPGTLGRALALYHSMFGPNSKLNPTIIHVNAVIKVCARCNDMDSLWDIVTKLPEKGPLAADARTFTIIFNHMRYQALTSPKAGDQSERAKRAATLIKARQMWAVVVTRWRQGELKLDEDVTCALGRLLLAAGTERDCDDILSLVEQTTRIERLIPPLSEFKSADPKPGVKGPSPSPNTMLSSPIRRSEASSKGNEFAPVNYDPRSMRSNRPGGKAFYVIPDAQMLQLILEACQKLKYHKIAIEYCQLLTSAEYNITPDIGCFHGMLRAYRNSRSSTPVVDLMLENLPRWKIRPLHVTYRIALGACLRDKNNPNVMDNASRLFESMQNTLPEPDPIACEKFLQLAKITKDDKTICRAIRLMHPVIINLRSYLNFGPTKGDDWATSESKMLDGEQRKLVVELMQTMSGCYDYVLRPGSSLRQDERTRRDFVEKKAALAAFITRYRNGWMAKGGEPAKKWGPSGYDHLRTRKRIVEDEDDMENVESAGGEDGDGYGRNMSDDEWEDVPRAQEPPSVGLDRLDKRFATANPPAGRRTAAVRRTFSN